ncbi:hypothetical protein L1278_001492 [Pontibacter sp. HSC-36F09]|nr:hypothetical protein [Pontibacter sp. HSC-36F09]
MPVFQKYFITKAAQPWLLSDFFATQDNPNADFGVYVYIDIL